jgi:hypothetical protein
VRPARSAELSMPFTYAERRNRVFHKKTVLSGYFCNNRKQTVSKTMEANMTKPRTVLTKDVELSAQWQTGLATSTGYAQRKLRLSFAPSHLIQSQHTTAARSFAYETARSFDEE